MDIEILKGKTLVSVDGEIGGMEAVFQADSGERYKMLHVRDCCEHVYLDDICGEFSDLIGAPLLEAEKIEGEHISDEETDSLTWTFYKLGTIKGCVTLVWRGESNGYYSEGVDFLRLDESGEAIY